MNHTVQMVLVDPCDRVAWLLPDLYQDALGNVAKPNPSVKTDKIFGDEAKNTENHYIIDALA